MFGNSVYGFFQDEKPIKESSSLLGAGSWFSHDGVRAQVVPPFVKSRTETGSRRDVPEAMHGGIAVLDSPMVLCQAMSEIGVASMKHTIAQRFAYGPWIGGVPICRDLFRHMANHGKRLREKCLGCLHVSLLTQP